MNQCPKSIIECDQTTRGELWTHCSRYRCKEDLLEKTTVSQAQVIKAKRNKWNCMKQRIFCMAKKLINKVKRMPTNWEKAFANYSTDWGLISRIYQELDKLNRNIANNPVNKWDGHELTFVKDWDPSGQNTWKKVSGLPALGDMQIKTKMRLPSPQWEWLSENDMSYWGCGETVFTIHCWLKCKLVQLFWVQKLLRVWEKNIYHMTQPLNPGNLSQWKSISTSNSYLYPMFIVAQFTKTKRWINTDLVNKWLDQEHVVYKLNRILLNI